MRRIERACPFCGVVLAIEAPTMRVVSERLGRAAIFSIGAAAMTNVGGCGARTELREPIAIDAGPIGHDAGQILASYGGPPHPHDAGHDVGGPFTHYGGPPRDAAFVEEDSGAVGVLYGGPELTPDVGVDMGCSNADYGAPPCP